jgi:hypothetical protein
MIVLEKLRQICYHDKGNNRPQRWQRCLHIKVNNAIESNNHHRNKGKDACASMATMPSRQGQ